MRCPRCEQAVVDGAPTCASCGQTIAAGDVALAAPAARPAHLAVLDGMAQTEPKPAKARLVSSAGPSLPVTPMRADDDAVPAGASGWMARLEQAKRAAPPDAPPPLPASPPPLPPPLPKKTNGGAKPAHLLIAELEAAEQEKRAAKVRTSSIQSAEDEISKSEIANVEIPKPETDIADRHVPKWVYGAAVLVVLAGIGASYWWAEEKTPVEVKKVDPELIAKHERARTANAAIEEGHTLLGDTKDPAKIELAIAAYRRALTIDPKFARAERALGVAFAAKGDDATAADHYRRFLELEPDAPEAAQVRAIIAKYEAKGKK